MDKIASDAVACVRQQMSSVVHLAHSARTLTREAELLPEDHVLLEQQSVAAERKALLQRLWRNRRDARDGATLRAGRGPFGYLRISHPKSASFCSIMFSFGYNIPLEPMTPTISPPPAPGKKAEPQVDSVVPSGCMDVCDRCAADFTTPVCDGINGVFISDFTTDGELSGEDSSVIDGDSDHDTHSKCSHIFDADVDTDANSSDDENYSNALESHCCKAANATSEIFPPALICCDHHDACSSDDESDSYPPKPSSNCVNTSADHYLPAANLAFVEHLSIYQPLPPAPHHPTHPGTALYRLRTAVTYQDASLSCCDLEHDPIDDDSGSEADDEGEEFSEEEPDEWEDPREPRRCRGHPALRPGWKITYTQFHDNGYESRLRRK